MSGDWSWLATFAGNNAALFVVAVIIIAFFKWGMPYFKDAAIVFKSTREGIAAIDKKLDQHIQTDDVRAQRQDAKLTEVAEELKLLSCEQFKKIVYRTDMPISDRVANYVRYRRLGGNGETQEYFQQHVFKGNEELCRTVFEIMGYKEA